MINSPIQDEVGVVFIPDYTVTALKASGLTLEAMNKLVIASNAKDSDGQRLADLLGGISLTDIEDTILVNRILINILFKISYPEITSLALGLIHGLEIAMYSKKNTYVISDDKKYDLLNIYFNKNIDNDSILVSEDKNEVFTLVNTGDTLFVVLHDGFTNFIVNNDTEVQAEFLNSLMDYMFTKLGRERVYNSELFSKFIATK